MQPCILDALSARISESPAQLFLSLDYDALSDRRYRHAIFPAVSYREGFTTLSSPRQSNGSQKVMSIEAKPEPSHLVNTVEKLRNAVLNDFYIARKSGISTTEERESLEYRVTAIETELAEAEARSHSLAEFNSVLLSRLCNIRLALPTAFVAGRAALAYLAEPMEYLWLRGREMTRAYDNAGRMLEDVGVVVRPALGRKDLAPFWVVCDCGERLPLLWLEGSQLNAEAVCGMCRRGRRVTARTFRELAEDGYIAPRVVADNLLDGIGWAHSFGCGYRGGLEHYVFASVVGWLLELRLMPDFLSQRSSSASCGGLVGSDYRGLLEIMIGRGSKRAYATSDLIRSGKGSVAHSLVWGAPIRCQYLI
jgi:hypothetical protein